MSNELLELLAGEVRKCAYEKCPNVIPAAHAFVHCDVCRTLITRNSLTLLLDPHSPHPSVTSSQGVFAQLITNLTGEEMIRSVEKMEAAYLAMQRHIHLYKVGAATPRANKSLVESLAEGRELVDAPKTRKIHMKKGEKRADKLTKLLGGDKAEARRLMGETFEL